MIYMFCVYYNVFKDAKIFYVYMHPQDKNFRY